MTTPASVIANIVGNLWNSTTIAVTTGGRQAPPPSQVPVPGTGYNSPYPPAFQPQYQPVYQPQIIPSGTLSGTPSGTPEKKKKSRKNNKKSGKKPN
jgi:hypothetical protein